MRDLKTAPLTPSRPWLPSFDVHEANGELIVHADLSEEAEITLDGGDLIVRTGSGQGRLPLPFAPRCLHAVSRPGHGDLEVHVLPKEEAMSWEEARNREIAHWSAVRGAIGTASPVELLTEINAADAFCEKAREEAGSPAGICSRCLFYQQFGGCRETGGRMSEQVAARDWEGLRSMVDEVIARLRALDVPAI